MAPASLIVPAIIMIPEGTANPRHQHQSNDDNNNSNIYSYYINAPTNENLSCPH
jgi:hypothetical protein